MINAELAVSLMVAGHAVARACWRLSVADVAWAHMLVLPWAAVACRSQSYAVARARRYGRVARRGRVTALSRRTGSVYQWVMADQATPPHSQSRYDAVAALFAALEELIDGYRSLPESEHVRRWSQDADRITGEVARHLAIARAHITATPLPDAH